MYPWGMLNKDWLSVTAMNYNYLDANTTPAVPSKTVTGPDGVLLHGNPKKPNSSNRIQFSYMLLILVLFI